MVIDYASLLESPRQAREHAYAPYSHFRVGAALLTRWGKVFTGCNIENISLGLTICAERSAVSAAIGGGAREFSAIGLVTNFSRPVFPCGACRQVLAEFTPGMAVISATVGGRIENRPLSELLLCAIKNLNV